MPHTWLSETGGNCATVRAGLVDFRKAFDLIDRKILIQKLTTYDLHSSIVTWVKDCLTGIDKVSSFLSIVTLNGRIFNLESSKGPSWVRGSLPSWLTTYQLDIYTILLSLRRYLRTTIARSSNMFRICPKKCLLTGSNSTKISITFPRSRRDFDPIEVNTKNIECVKKSKNSRRNLV